MINAFQRLGCNLLRNFFDNGELFQTYGSLELDSSIEKGTYMLQFICEFLELKRRLLI